MQGDFGFSVVDSGGPGALIGGYAGLQGTFGPSVGGLEGPWVFSYFLCKFVFFREDGQSYRLKFLHICSAVYFPFPIQFYIVRCFLKMVLRDE